MVPHGVTVKKALRPEELELQRYLQIVRGFRRSMERSREFVYLGKEDFLLRHGLWYQPQPFPRNISRGVIKACFWNSMLAAKNNGWKYVEGVAVAGLVPFPVDHAWNVTQDGALIDTTWGNTGITYLGVEFSYRRARHVLNQGEAVLDNYFDRYALFRQPWKGEDFTLTWKKPRRRPNEQASR